MDNTQKKHLHLKEGCWLNMPITFRENIHTHTHNYCTNGEVVKKEKLNWKMYIKIKVVN